jgi:hypothetical protein
MAAQGAAGPQGAAGATGAVGPAGPPARSALQDRSVQWDRLGLQVPESADSTECRSLQRLAPSRFPWELLMFWSNCGAQAGAGEEPWRKSEQHQEAEDPVPTSGQRWPSHPALPTT